MWAWMPGWLFGFAVLVELTLLSVNGLLGILLGLAWGLVVFPRLAIPMTRRWRRSVGLEEPEEPALDYWRTERWQSGVH